MIDLAKYFDEHTMSVHLRVGTYPYAKKGHPGSWELVKLSEEILSHQEIEALAEDVVEKTHEDDKSFIEISRRSSTIVQYKDFRVVIVRPPVADAMEITAVKPLVKLDLNKYNIPEKILNRINERSSGIIISGQVGSGKSTFASALAEEYVKLGRITKTLESPRDLLVGDDITQYSKNFGDEEEIHDILFLSRPDNVIFDEMRDSPDFKLYIDIRLGGSAVIGVLHAATPIDTIQRFISRMEVGMIPSVLDTIIFIDKGEIGQVFTLKMMVKVPSGMTESDLARPIIEVKDLESGKLMFEIYSYGEETVVIPIKGDTKKSPAHSLAEKQIKKEFMRLVDSVEVEMIGDHKVRVYVPKGSKGKIIGAKGVKIAAVEKRLGIKIDVQEMGETSRAELERLGYHVKERGRNLILQLDSPGRMVDVFIGEEFLFTSTTSKKGEIRVNMKSDIGLRLVRALDTGEKVYVKG
jgi:ATPase